MKHFIPSMLLILALSSFAAKAESFDDDAETIVQDNACFVISGTAFDHNGALSKLKAAESRGSYFNFAGYSCRIFNSYKEMRDHVASAKLPKNSGIFLLQIAHGGASGTGMVNSGQIEAKQIAKEIRDLSVDYKVIFLNQSCYGGSMLLEKISWDQNNQDSKSIDRTCLWADSIPGRVAYIDDSLPHQKNPYSLEDAYAQFPGGTLSSAAWSQAGTAQYYDAVSKIPVWDLKTDATSDILFPLAGNFLTGLNNVVQEGKLPSSFRRDLIESAKFVLSDETNDEDLRAVLKSLGKNSFNSEAIRQAIFFPPASRDACTLSVRKFLVSQWYIEFQQTPSPWQGFEKNLRNGFALYPEIGRNCLDYGQSNVTVHDWVEWLAQHSPIADEMREYARNKDNIDDYFRPARLNSFMSSFSKNDYLNKYEIVMSLIGREINKEETKTVQVSATSTTVTGIPTMGTRGATGNVIPAFTLASFNLQRMENDLDERRRNACRSIKLKAW